MDLEIFFNNSEADLLFFALQNKTRRQIIKLLHVFPHLNVSQIATQLNQTEANISVQVKILQNAKIINAVYKPGRHGVIKEITKKYNTILIHFKKKSKKEED